MIRYPCSPPPPAQHVPPPPKGPLPSIPLSFLPSVSSHNVARMLLYQLIFKRLLFRNTAARALLCLVPDGLVQTTTRCSFPSTRFAKVKGKKEKKKKEARRNSGTRECWRSWRERALLHITGRSAWGCHHLGKAPGLPLRGGWRRRASFPGRQLWSRCAPGRTPALPVSQPSPRWPAH